jgi:hypothetical protein
MSLSSKAMIFEVEGLQLLVHYGACLHGQTTSPLAFCLHSNLIMIKPTFGFGERNTDGGPSCTSWRQRNAVVSTPNTLLLASSNRH